MRRFKNGILAAEILFLVARLLSGIDGVVSTISSSSCMTAYDDGGAPAVLQSSECASQWGFMVESLKNSTKNCEFASLQGHRKYQEDRVTCNLDIRIHSIDATNEGKVDLLAIFDGHGGTEASEAAKQHLLDYFLVHVIAGAFKNNNQNDLITAVKGPHGSVLEIEDKYLHDILKEALLGAIRDIDLKFSSEAIQKRYNAGSTASVVLLLNNEEFLVATVGDSKVILCAVIIIQIEMMSGPRVNGILAVSRAIGDVSLKRYGVIAEPELVGWRNMTDKHSYLVVASDGVFESLTPESVCQLIEDANVEENGTAYDNFPFLPSSSLAYYVVKTALKRGSTDNLSAIVVPLAQAALVHKDEL